MKQARRAVWALAAVLLGHPAWGEEETKRLECQGTQGDSERVTYLVTAQGRRIFVEKLTNGIRDAKVPLSAHGATAIQGYGGTYLYADDLGRSGYLIIYSHQWPGEPTHSLIDIRLFQEAARGLNTSGPRTDFECAAPVHR